MSASGCGMDSPTAMHTYKTPEGEFYDDVEPHSKQDVALPLRPSLIHRWNGRKWVWVGKKIISSYPRSGDAEPLSPAQLRDLAILVHETAEIQQYQTRMVEQLRTDVAINTRSMAEHLEEAKPLLETLRGLRTISKASVAISTTLNGVANLLRGIWRVSLFILAAYLLILALAHGNPFEIKRAIGLMFG